jgi:hypothetical protein
MGLLYGRDGRGGTQDVVRNLPETHTNAGAPFSSLLAGLSRQFANALANCLSSERHPAGLFSAVGSTTAAQMRVAEVRAVLETVAKQTVEADVRRPNAREAQKDVDV